MTQSNGDLNRAYLHSVLPYEAGSKRGSRQIVQVNGFAAKVELHVNEPELLREMVPRLSRPKAHRSPPH